MAIVALIVAGFALLISVAAIVVTGRFTQHMPTASRVSRWRSETGDLEERMESLESRLRRLSSKYSMREKRAAGKMNGSNPEQPDEETIDPEQWKLEMNRKIATGEIKVR